jgi:hypothetical protein
MTTSDFKLAQIALACWRAAQGELHQVMLAVAQTFMNRGGDLYEETTKWLSDNPGAFPDPRDPQFQQLLARLDSVTIGLAKDVTDGAWAFVRKTDLQPDMLQAFSITTQIGGLVFVKGK